MTHTLDQLQIIVLYAAVWPRIVAATSGAQKQNSIVGRNESILDLLYFNVRYYMSC